MVAYCFLFLFRQDLVDGSALHGKVVDFQDNQYIVQFDDDTQDKFNEIDLEGMLFKDRFVKFSSRDYTVGDLIKRFHDNYGVEVPIFCFGFSKMQRGVGFRCEERVPTHYIQSYGQGYSLEKTIQSLGRATFIGKSVLNRLGFSSVRIMASQSDLEAAKAYQRFQVAVYRSIVAGQSLSEAMNGSLKLLPAEANFARLTSRKMGEIKGLRRLYNHDAFEESEELHPSEERTKLVLWEKMDLQRMMLTWSNLSRTNHRPMVDSDLMDAYNDQFKGRFSIVASKAKSLNTELWKHNLLERECVEGGTKLYTCPNKKKLQKFINPAADPEPDETTSAGDLHSSTSKKRIKIEDCTLSRKKGRRD